MKKLFVKIINTLTIDVVVGIIIFTTLFGLLILAMCIRARGQGFHQTPAFKAAAAQQNRTILYAPVNTVRPSIDNNAPSGTGVLLTATAGTYSNAVSSYVRQWKRSGTNIASATDLTYTTVTEDQGQGLSFYEKAVNSAGDSGFVRAETRLPRPFFISGDSLFAGLTLFNGGAFAPLLQSALGTNWNVINVAVSAANILQMEVTAQSLVDPFIQKGWGVSFFHEYANSCTGLQGTNDGITTAELLHAFGTNRQTAGAGAVVTSTSYYRTVQTSATNESLVYDGSNAHQASEIVRTNYQTFADGFLDFDYLPFYQSSTNNDAIHWNLGSTDTTYLVGLFTNKIALLGLAGGCGDVPVPNPPGMDHLRTYVTATYVYDPVNPLPASIPFQPDASCYMYITNGAGWDLGGFLVTGKIDDFPTVDGNQRLYSLSPPQSTGGLSGGSYYFSTNAP